MGKMKKINLGLSEVFTWKMNSKKGNDLNRGMLHDQKLKLCRYSYLSRSCFEKGTQSFITYPLIYPPLVLFQDHFNGSAE